jgi:hypothetical protein
MEPGPLITHWMRWDETRASNHTLNALGWNPGLYSHTEWVGMEPGPQLRTASWALGLVWTLSQRAVTVSVSLTAQSTCLRAIRFRSFIQTSSYLLVVRVEAFRFTWLHSLGLLWTSDRPVTETSYLTIHNTHNKPSSRRDSNPPSQQASGYRDTSF